MIARAGSGAGSGRQQGVVGLLYLSVLGLLVACGVLVLDVGRLYYERQNLQRIADLAVLAATVRADVVASADAPQLEAVAWESAARHGFASQAGSHHALQVRTGQVTLAGQSRQFDSAAARSLHDAVQVRAERQVRSSIAGNLGALLPGMDMPSRTRLQATAVAQRRLQPAFSVGNTLLTADLSASPLLGPLLQELLGGHVALDAVGFRGLVGASVTLGDLLDLALEAGLVSAADLEGLLNLELTLAELADLALAALHRSDDNGVLLDGQIGALQELVEILAVAPAGALQDGIRLAGLLRVEVLDPEAEAHLLGVDLGLGELLNGALLLAHQGNFVRVENLQIGGDDFGLPAGASSPLQVSLELEVIEPPQLAIGPAGCQDGSAAPCMQAWQTEARTAQLQLDTHISLDLLQLVTLDLGLEIDSAGGVAGIERISPVSEAGHDVEVAGRGSVLSLDLQAGLALLSGLDGLLSLDVSADSTAAQSQLDSGTDRAILQWPEQRRATLTPSAVGTLWQEVDGLLSNLELDLQLGPDAETCSGLILVCSLGNALGTVLGPVLDGVSALAGFAVETAADLLGVLGNALGALTAELLEPLLAPLLDALGISVVELEVEVLDVHAGSVELVM